MSGPEDRPDLPADQSPTPPLPPPPPPDAPTQVGIPVPAASNPSMPPAAPPPPPPAFEPPPSTGGSATLIVAMIGLLIALLLLGVILFGLILNPSRPGTTPAGSLPVSSGEPVASAQTTAPTDGGPAATDPSPAAGASVPPASPTATQGTPATPEDELLSHVPPHLRAGCQLDPGEAPALAVASCQADDGRILATYFLYPDGEAMERAYGGFVQDSGIDRDSGRCADPETWPAEGTYRVAGEPAGRVLCMTFSESPTMYWTDTRLNILTWAFHFEGDTDRLFEFWTDEAGPAQ